YYEGNFGEARDYLTRSIQVHRESGFRRGVAMSTLDLGDVAHMEGDYDEARRLYAEGLQIGRQSQIADAIGTALIRLGRLAHDAGDGFAARRDLREGLAVARDRRLNESAIQALEGFAAVAAAEGEAARGLRLAGAAAAARRATHTPISPVEAPLLVRWLAPARAALSREEQDAAWEEGSRMPRDEAVAYALEVTEAA
ncbi:MAG TPA: tetratricopeptide repeat protein, partial [Chloroflexota bacterium]|nr:tetratricopeptide repeat protein [Chloroflexota bacterium]